MEVSHQLRKQGKKVVFTHGAFDLFHKGHSMMLETSKKKGDVLIVGVDPDSNIKKYKNRFRPIINENDRMHILSKHECTDFVFLMEELEYVNGSNPEYFAEFYRVMNPNLITYGINFAYKKDFEKKFRGIKHAEIVHRYDSTTGIIKRILNVG